MFYFLFLMLSSSSIKELLHKPAEIQWNITETLPGKLRRKFLGLYPSRYYPPKSQKREKSVFDTLGAWEPICNSMVFKFQPLYFG